MYSAILGLSIGWNMFRIEFKHIDTFRWLAVMAVVLTLTFAGCHSATKDFNVGVLYPKTGEYARLGELIGKGARIAEQSANQRLFTSGRGVKLSFRDSEGKPGIAREQFLAFADLDKVPVVVGGLLSSDTKAFAKDAVRKNITVVANGSSDPTLRDIVGDAGNRVFRNWPSDDAEGRQMAEYTAERLHMKRGAAIIADEPYSRGLHSAFKRRFAELGGSTTEQFYQKGGDDFAILATKALSEAPQFIYAVGFPAELGRLAREIRVRRADVPMISAVGIESTEFLEAAGTGADNIFYSAPYIDTSSNSYQEFAALYRATYHEDPEVVAAVTFDAVMLVAQAIKQCGYSADGIRDCLYKVKDYPGASGVTSFDARGDVIKPVSIKRVEKGKTFLLEVYRAR
jgi:branched-chain amino acid transport system substrate-binding protein